MFTQQTRIRCSLHPCGHILGSVNSTSHIESDFFKSYFICGSKSDANLFFFLNAPSVWSGMWLFLGSTLNTLDQHSTWSCTGQNHKQKHYSQDSPCCPEILDVKLHSWLHILPLFTKVEAFVPQTHNCNINSPLHSSPVHHLPQHLPVSTAQYLKTENAYSHNCGLQVSGYFCTQTIVCNVMFCASGSHQGCDHFLTGAKF